MAWWVQFWAFIAVAQVQFLVRELRSYKPHSVVKKKTRRKFVTDKRMLGITDSI